MQSAKPNQGAHPNILDRNKAIIWSRYLIDSSDWLIFASKVTYLNSDQAERGPEREVHRAVVGAREDRVRGRDPAVAIAFTRLLAVVWWMSMARARPPTPMSGWP